MLVVDGREDAAAVLAEVLATAGFQVATCPPGARVLQAVRDESVAVVVVATPDAPDGTEVAAPLVAELRGRTEPQVRDAGLVVLVDSAAGAAAATMAGADATVGRPVDPARLVAAVTEVSSVPPDVRQRRRP